MIADLRMDPRDHPADLPAAVLVVGPWAPELEAVAQALAAAEIPSTGVVEPDDALATARARPPIAVLMAGATARAMPALLTLPIAPGGAVLLWHPFDATAVALAAVPVHRLVLADLALPLERHRLVSLVRHLIARSRDAGHTATGRPFDAPAADDSCAGDPG